MWQKLPTKKDRFNSMTLRDPILESAIIRNRISGLIWADSKHREYASGHAKICLDKKTLFYNLELEGILPETKEKKTV